MGVRGRAGTPVRQSCFWGVLLKMCSYLSCSTEVVVLLRPEPGPPRAFENAGFLEPSQTHLEFLALRKAVSNRVPA